MGGVEATSAAMVSFALQALSSSARPRGPSMGSVRFWVSTAPMPARAKMHRLPTLRFGVEIDSPKAPVRPHRPAIENVMPCPLLGLLPPRNGGLSRGGRSAIMAAGDTRELHDGP